MAKPALPAKKSPGKTGFVLGRSRFEKISAVEGIRTSAASREMFADFDRRGLSDEERRAAISRKHLKKA